MKNSFKIEINDKYTLVPLLEVRKDDLSNVFKKGKGVYICNFPDQYWYDAHNFKQTTNYSIDKKENFFRLMEEGSVILSPTQDSKIHKPTKTFNFNKVFHIGSSYTGRLAQIIIAAKMIFWLFQNRKKYNYCFIYNFYPAEILAASFARIFLKKRVIVDFEDDCLMLTRNRFYLLYFNLAKKIPHEVIYINSNMQHYFTKQITYVFNGFIDLSYTKSCEFTLKEGTTFLYSGALDKIRGVDLIPELIQSLRQKIKNFKIIITGSGPLEEVVKKWKFEEVIFLGFLSTGEYEKVLSKSDAFLVLQKPDHPFSLGSFPSKIEYYTKFKKPIYKLI